MSEFDELLKKFEATEKEASPEDNKLPVLLIDDDESIRRGLTRALSYKYIVKTAETGIKGISLLDKSIYCVILDVKMKELNGFSTYPKLKSKCPDVPIIFYTAFQSEHDLQEVINKYKPEGYVEKGRDISFLVNLIENAVKRYKLVLENEEYKENLERKVEERTADLKHANEELTKTFEELQKFQSQLIQERTLGAVGTLASGVAHNFKNILKGIGDSVKLLVNDTKDNFYHPYTFEKFDIIDKDREELIRFINEKYYSDRKIEFIDGMSAINRSNELRGVLEKKGVYLKRKYLRKLANINISKKDLEFILPYLSKYVPNDIIDLFDLSYKIGCQSQGVLQLISNGNKIIKNIMTITQMAQRNDRETNLNDVIDKFIEDTRKEVDNQKIKIIKNYDINLPNVKIDKKIIQTVFENLYSNSIDALKTIKKKREIIVSTYMDDDDIYLDFTDNGIGIEESEINKVFEPFYTTKKGSNGLGIGLFLSYSLLKSYGDMIVKSEKGYTTFTIKINKEHIILDNM